MLIKLVINFGYSIIKQLYYKFYIYIHTLYYRGNWEVFILFSLNLISGLG